MQMAVEREMVQEILNNDIIDYVIAIHISLLRRELLPQQTRGYVFAEFAILFSGYNLVKVYFTRQFILIQIE